MCIGHPGDSRNGSNLGPTWDNFGTIFLSFWATSPTHPAPPDNQRSLQPRKPSTNETTNQPSLQTTKPSTNQVFNQPSLQPTKPSTNPAFNQPTIQPTPIYYDNVDQFWHGRKRGNEIEDLVGGRLGWWLKGWLVEGVVG